MEVLDPRFRETMNIASLIEWWIKYRDAREEMDENWNPK
jgi:uncharacterized protein YjiS (DUF1127 family)